MGVPCANSNETVSNHDVDIDLIEEVIPQGDFNATGAYCKMWYQNTGVSSVTVELKDKDGITINDNNGKPFRFSVNSGEEDARVLNGTIKQGNQYNWVIYTPDGGYTVSGHLSILTSSNEL